VAAGGAAPTSRAASLAVERPEAGQPGSPVPAASPGPGELRGPSRLAPITPQSAAQRPTPLALPGPGDNFARAASARAASLASPAQLTPLSPAVAGVSVSAAAEVAAAKTLSLRTTAISLTGILDHAVPAGRKTKIVCTLGPSCWSEEGLAALLDAGMDVARFNFSHGAHADHQAVLDRLRKVRG
jgi:hypothetical protein